MVFLVFFCSETFLLGDQRVTQTKMLFSVSQVSMLKPLQSRVQKPSLLVDDC